MYEANGLYLAACRFIQSTFVLSHPDIDPFLSSLGMEMNLKSICNECTRFLFVDLNLERLNSVELKLEFFFNRLKQYINLEEKMEKWKDVERIWKVREYESIWKECEPKKERISTENGENMK